MRIQGHGPPVEKCLKCGFTVNLENRDIDKEKTPDIVYIMCIRVWKVCVCTGKLLMWFLPFITT